MGSREERRIEADRRFGLAGPAPVKISDGVDGATESACYPRAICQ